jgi:hypothetical protein
MLGFPINETQCWIGDNKHSLIRASISAWNGSIAFAPYWKRTWHEGGVPEFPIAESLRRVVEEFRLKFLPGKYLALHWRMERTNFKDVETILQGMIRRASAALSSREVDHILLSTDLSFEFGTSTLDVREYAKWEPIQRRLMTSLPKRPIMFNISSVDTASIAHFDRAMVGLIEQELHVHSQLFCPAIVRSGFVRTILRKRYRLDLPSEILLAEDLDIWKRDLEMYRRLKILPINQ